MKKLSSLIIYLLISTTLFGQAAMQYKLSPGDVFTIKQDANQIIIQEIDGATHEITNTLEGLMEFRVKADNNTAYAIDVMFKDLNLKMTSSIQGVLMNIRARDYEADDAQSKIFNSLLDVPIQITLARTGDILEVSGGDSLVSKMANASGVKDDFSLNMMKKSLENDFGSEALSSSYEQLTYLYPIAPIEVGDSWNNEYSGKLQAQNTWTLNEITAESAKIDGKALVIMDIVEASSSMKLSGTQDSSVITDITTGFVKKMTVRGLAEGYTTMTQMGNIEIPTRIESTIIYELIEN